MSKDDGTYVLMLKGERVGLEYRVAHAHAIENIFQDQSLVAAVFRHSQRFTSVEEAKNEAGIKDAAEQTEHGVMFIEDFQEHTWPEIEALAEKEKVSFV